MGANELFTGVRGRPRRALVALPFALIALISLIDALTPAYVELGPLLMAAPAVTAAFAGPRLTALVGVLAVGARLTVASFQHTAGIASRDGEIAALAAGAIVVVAFTAVRDRHRRVLSQVRSVSEAAQKVLLRPLPDRIGPLTVASVYLAAEAEAQIGGDLYAAARTHTSTRLLIGDVRGKGLAAVGDAAMLLGSFYGFAHRQENLPALAAHLDGSVRWDPHSGENSGEERFVTAVLLDFPDHGGCVHMVNCGHPPPLMLHRGTVVPLDRSPSAPPLGLGEFNCGDYLLDKFPFEEDDLLLLYTDGVVEARDKSGAFYVLPERLSAWGDRAPDDVLRRLRGDLLAYVGGRLTDDAAAVAVMCTPPQRHASAAGDARPE
ncbi:MULTISPECIES: PP2C family protein-serine/threonine phosphatase [unclassified Streptomyces]|uniref:PP2C family protein-serine/threonine phosphatase n=1 Tax=unclassified Streptomyces TaxID=2593676 RepID=UPI000C2781BF|nr:PP2C family protein-serine/threonine phosphatase [Streptomyces sp. CB01373]PJM92922.1 protein phosphatase [Streptomyces sp. CB01373]